MTYKVRMTAPKSAIEGWQGRISIDDRGDLGSAHQICRRRSSGVRQ
jgi:hypothetical protein